MNIKVRKIVSFASMFLLLALLFVLALDYTVNLPVMYKSNRMQKCVRVMSESGEKPCSFITQGDKYHLVWVQ